MGVYGLPTVSGDYVRSGGVFLERLDKTGLEVQVRLEGKAAGALRSALARCLSQGLWPGGSPGPVASEIDKAVQGAPISPLAFQNGFP